MHENNSPIINLEKISFSYPGEPMVIDELDFIFYPGDRSGLIAPNGSGKTTFFHIIMGLVKPSYGKMEIFGKPACKKDDFLNIRGKIGLLFQDADDQLFCPTVLEDVAFGPLNMGKSKEEAIEISRKTLDSLGLAGFEDRITYKLSGGEKRLVSLATVLSMKPEILLLDEPLTGLDTETRLKLIDILPNLDLSYILISHEIDFLTATTKQIYTMKDGKILVDDQDYIHKHEHVHQLGRIPHRHR
ncbi:MAG: energy-coupling factor ABC transporter ATP-binding protein [Thermodesulfobacteriota bacterium]|nr:energy-coupling factor ABC transporter ATP-binding protein [Thermodesulfobacteriota bacterium]